MKWRDQREFLQKAKELTKLATSADTDPVMVIEKSQEFLIDYLDNFIATRAGLSAEDMEDMDFEDKQKLITQIKGILVPGGDKGFF